MLEKTVESPLDCKEIKPVHPKGNQPECSLEEGAPSKSQRERRGLGNEMVLTGQYREETGGACSGGAKRR